MHGAHVLLGCHTALSLLWPAVPKTLFLTVSSLLLHQVSSSTQSDDESCSDEHPEHVQIAFHACVLSLWSALLITLFGTVTTLLAQPVSTPIGTHNEDGSWAHAQQVLLVKHGELSRPVKGIAAQQPERPCCRFFDLFTKLMALVHITKGLQTASGYKPC